MLHAAAAAAGSLCVASLAVVARCYCISSLPPPLLLLYSSFLSLLGIYIFFPSATVMGKTEMRKKAKGDVEGHSLLDGWVALRGFLPTPLTSLFSFFNLAFVLLVASMALV